MAENRKRKEKRTFVAIPDSPAVDHGLPGEQLIVADGAEALDALLARRLAVLPRVELLEQAADGVAGGRGRHCPRLLCFVGLARDRYSERCDRGGLGCSARSNRGCLDAAIDGIRSAQKLCVGWA
jgi:hypothetical protein